jgi:curli production assembly/transport component CsgG
LGFGFGTNKIFENRHSKIQYGAGLEYLSVQKIGIKAFAEQNINFSDTIDYLERGVRDDYYFRFGVGLTYYFQIKRQLEKQLLLQILKK